MPYAPQAATGNMKERIYFLDIVHRPVFDLKHFGDCALPLFSGKKPTQLGPIDRACLIRLYRLGPTE
jgi:hypothetical protein